MANTITGRVHRISPTESGVTKGGKPFTKRNIVLDCTRFDQYTGERGFENYPSFDFFNEKCQELDKFQAGQVVTIHFDVVGAYYQPTDKYITNVKPYKIEPRQTAQNSMNGNVQQSQPIPTAPQPQSVQHGGYAPAQPTAPQIQGQPAYGAGYQQQPNGMDNLPF